MNWSDITIAQFQELDRVRNEQYEFTVDKEIAVLECITGRKDLDMLPKDELVEVARETEFLRQPLSEKLVRSIKIKGRRFNLLHECQKLSAQQVILIMKYCPDLTISVQNLHYLLAVITNEKHIFRKDLPFDHDFEGKAELFKGVGIETVHASCVFFCKVYNAWLETTQTYLVSKAKELKLKMEKELKMMNQK